MKRRVALSIGLGLSLAACSDGVGPDGLDQLGRAEALQITASMIAAGEAAASTSFAASPPASAQSDAGTQVGAATSFTHTHQSSHPCPTGGTLDVAFVLEGSFDANAHSLQADLSGSHTHNACGFVSEGITYKVTGDPNIAFEASVGAVNGEPSQPFTYSLNGAFDWSASDDRSGSCVVNVEVVTDFNARQRTLQASICGHTVNETTTWS